MSNNLNEVKDNISNPNIEKEKMNNCCTEKEVINDDKDITVKKLKQKVKRKNLTDDNLSSNVNLDVKYDVDNFDFISGKKLSINSYSQNMYVTSSDNMEMDHDSDNKNVSKMYEKNSLINKLNNNSDSTMLSAKPNENFFNSNESLKISIDKVIQYKKRGNELIKEGKNKEAIECFEAGLKALNKNYEKVDLGTKSNIDSIKIDCLNNIAMCNYLVKNYNKVLSYTQQVSYFFI